MTWLCGIGILLSCNPKKSEKVQKQKDTLPKENSKVSHNHYKIDFDTTKAQRTPSGIIYVITREGTKPAQKGKKAYIHYTGRFLDNQIIHTSQGKEPFWFRLGAKPSVVIPGIEEAVMLLKEGGKGNFLIPAQLCYGKEGYDIIPPNTPLYYEIELVKLQ
ncbi:MAG: FKBP-type peptidyl-prolyl cis-trans isomerase [Bacteroidia bacterium]|nr:FKBP-type peptidyl-prolyl cis-trans isomerase [Bacteroidia bacterium]